MKVVLWNNILERVHAAEENIKLQMAHDAELLLAQENFLVKENEAYGSVYGGNAPPIVENNSPVDSDDEIDVDVPKRDLKPSFQLARGDSIRTENTVKPSIDTSKLQSSDANWNAGNQPPGASVGTVLTKAFAKFVLGKDANSIALLDNSKYHVNIGVFLPGQYGLPPTRNGEVIIVRDDSFSSIIAYSLASNEYYEKLQEFIISSANNDYSNVDETMSSRGSNVSLISNFKRNHGPFFAAQEFNKNNNSNDQKFSAFNSNKFDDDEDDEEELQDEPEKKPQRESIIGSVTSGDRDSIIPASLWRGNSRKGKLFVAVNDSNKLGTVTEEDDGEEEVDDEDEHAPIQTETLPKTLDKNIFNDAMPDMKHFGKSPNKKSVVDRTLPAEEQKIKDEKQLLSQRKTHIKHRFEEVDSKGIAISKYVCHTFWATQFEALRAAYFESLDNSESESCENKNPMHSSEGFIRSLSTSADWKTTGGKSGAGFFKTVDDRFVIKVISRTELQMFLEFAPAYFEYMTKALFHRLPTSLVKILGVYQIGMHSRITGRKVSFDLYSKDFDWVFTFLFLDDGASCCARKFILSKKYL